MLTMGQMMNMTVTQLVPLQSSSSQPRDVNAMLHTLRGEHFRHIQNLRGRHVSVSSASFESTGRSFPAYYGTEEVVVPQVPSEDPPTPKSWARKAEHDTPTWRLKALSLVFTSLPSYRESGITQYVLSATSVPPLVLLCLRTAIMSTSADEFSESIVPFLPIHLCRDLIRYYAIRSPLSFARISAMSSPEGHIDGELVLVDPIARLPDDYFLRLINSASSRPSWDSDDALPEPLHTFIILSCPLSTSNLLTLPPTLTHIALLRLPSRIPLHRLVHVCPLLVFLDLSFNNWLDETVLERIDWSRWRKLHTLGLRECVVPESALKRINMSRWDDIEIIQH